MDDARVQGHAAMARLDEMLAEDLRRRGAFEMIAGDHFTGYLRVEPDGQISIEVWSWGVCHGKLFRGDTVEEVIQHAYARYR